MRIVTIAAASLTLLVGCTSDPIGPAGGQTSTTAPRDLTAERSSTSVPITAMVSQGCSADTACASGFAIGEIVYEPSGVDLVEAAIAPDDYAASYGAAGRTFARPLVDVSVDLAVGLRTEGHDTWTLALATNIDLDVAREIICEHGDLTPEQRAADDC